MSKYDIITDKLQGENNMSDSIPKMSIVIPVYNVKKYLRECLDSVINQTLKDIEIICINDGSTDGSHEILEAYAEKDKRIKVISKTNSGYGHTMNIGMDIATGKYLSIVESDDLAGLEMFENLYKTAEERNADVVKSNYYALCHGKLSQRKIFVEILPDQYYGKVIEPLKNIEIFRVQPSIWSAIYRLSMLRDNNIRFLETAGASYQDTAFNFKVWASAQRVVLLRDAYIHYRIDNANSSVKSGAKVFSVCDEYREIEEFLDNYPDKRERLEKLKNALKYETYMWNLIRLAPEFKYLFVKQMEKEFKQAEREGKLDRALFSAKEWRNVLRLLNNHKWFYIVHIIERMIKFIPRKIWDLIKR